MLSLPGIAAAGLIDLKYFVPACQNHSRFQHSCQVLATHDPCTSAKSTPRHVWLVKLKQPHTVVKYRDIQTDITVLQPLNAQLFRYKHHYLSGSYTVVQLQLTEFMVTDIVP